MLPDATALGAVHLRVGDLGRSLEFYHELVGLPIVARDATTATLGWDDAPLVRLRAPGGVAPAVASSPGLYHTAVLYPDRPTLGAVVRHISAAGYPFTGASDHLVSEAFYLDDPDGNGVELYRDRPRGEWRWHDGHVEMASIAADVDAILAQASATFDGAPMGTCVGHVHLQVSDLAEAQAFYGEVLGFALTANYGAAARFLAAGGYHHHVGMNTWRSRGRPAASRDHAGLDAFEVIVPSEDDVAAVRARATAAGVGVHQHDDGMVLTAPSDVEVIVRTR